MNKTANPWQGQGLPQWIIRVTAPPCYHCRRRSPRACRRQDAKEQGGDLDYTYCHTTPPLSNGLLAFLKAITGPLLEYFLDTCRLATGLAIAALHGSFQRSFVTIQGANNLAVSIFPCLLRGLEVSYLEH